MSALDCAVLISGASVGSLVATSELALLIGSATAEELDVSSGVVEVNVVE